MVDLGDTVVDTISGFRGVAIIKSEYLQGCCRIGVQPKIKKDGSLPELHHFDEPQLKVLMRKPVPKPRKTGGPTHSIAPEKEVETR